MGAPARAKKNEKKRNTHMEQNLKLIINNGNTFFVTHFFMQKESVCWHIQKCNLFFLHLVFFTQQSSDFLLQKPNNEQCHASPCFHYFLKIVMFLDFLVFLYVSNFRVLF